MDAAQAHILATPNVGIVLVLDRTERSWMRFFGRVVAGARRGGSGAVCGSLGLVKGVRWVPGVLSGAEHLAVDGLGLW